MNKHGDAPFMAPGAFSTPNEAYFAHADWVIQKAREKGLLVVLNPCYTGTLSPTNAAGWKTEILAHGPTRCRDSDLLIRVGSILGPFAHLRFESASV